MSVNTLFACLAQSLANLPMHYPHPVRGYLVPGKAGGHPTVPATAPL